MNGLATVSAFGILGIYVHVERKKRQELVLLITDSRVTGSYIPLDYGEFRAKVLGEDDLRRDLRSQDSQHDH